MRSSLYRLLFSTMELLSASEESHLQEERSQPDQEAELNLTEGDLNVNETSETTHSAVVVEENCSVVADSSSPSNVSKRETVVIAPTKVDNDALKESAVDGSSSLSRRESIIIVRSEVDNDGPNESAVDSSSSSNLSSNLSRKESIVMVPSENDNGGPSESGAPNDRDNRARSRRADGVDEPVYESLRIHPNSNTTTEIPRREGNESDNDVVVLHEISASERQPNASSATISLRHAFERRKAPVLQVQAPRSKPLRPSYSLKYPIDRGDSSSSREVVDLTVDEPLPKRKKIVRLSKLPENEAIVDRLKKELSCPVCLGAISKMASTTCGHIFCYSCIQQSVALRGRCPICSTRLVLKDVHRVFI